MQGLGSWNQFPKISNYLKTSAINFSGTQSASLYPELRSGIEFSLRRGRWQMPSARTNLWSTQETRCSQWVESTILGFFLLLTKRDELSPLSLGNKTDLVLAIQLFRNTHTHIYTHTTHTHTHTHTLKPTRLLCPCNSAGKNTGEGSHFFLQGVFLTQESKLGIPQCK